MRDDACGFGEFVKADFVGALRAEHHDLIANLDVGQMRDIRHGHVHRDGANQRCALAANQHPTAIAARAWQAVSIAAGNQRYAHWSEHFVGAAVADRRADGWRVKPNNSGLESDRTAQRTHAWDPTCGVAARERNSRAYGVQARPGDAQTAG